MESSSRRKTDKHILTPEERLSSTIPVAFLLLERTCFLEPCFSQASPLMAGFLQPPEVNNLRPLVFSLSYSTKIEKSIRLKLSKAMKVTGALNFIFGKLYLEEYDTKPLAYNISIIRVWFNIGCLQKGVKLSYFWWKKFVFSNRTPWNFKLCQAQNYVFLLPSPEPFLL